MIASQRFNGPVEIQWRSHKASNPAQTAARRVLQITATAPRRSSRSHRPHQMGNSLSAAACGGGKKGAAGKLGRLLEETTLNDICDKQNIVVIHDTATVEEALRVRRGAGAVARCFAAAARRAVPVVAHCPLPRLRRPIACRRALLSLRRASVASVHPEAACTAAAVPRGERGAIAQLLLPSLGQPPLRPLKNPAPQPPPRSCSPRGACCRRP